MRGTVVVGGTVVWGTSVLIATSEGGETGAPIQKINQRNNILNRKIYSNNSKNTVFLLKKTTMILFGPKTRTIIMIRIERGRICIFFKPSSILKF